VLLRDLALLGKLGLEVARQVGLGHRAGDGAFDGLTLHEWGDVHLHGGTGPGVPDTVVGGLCEDLFHEAGIGQDTIGLGGVAQGNPDVFSEGSILDGAQAGLDDRAYARRLDIPGEPCRGRPVRLHDCVEQVHGAGTGLLDALKLLSLLRGEPSERRLQETFRFQGDH